MVIRFSFGLILYFQFLVTVLPGVYNLLVSVLLGSLAAYFKHSEYLAFYVCLRFLLAYYVCPH